MPYANRATFAFAWSRRVARSGSMPTYQKTIEIVA